MDFRLNEDEQMLYDVCSRFAREQLAEAGAEADRQQSCPPELIEKGLELGLFLDAIPAEQGGYLEGDYSHTQRAVRAMALATGCPAIALRYEANTEVALAAAALGATDVLTALAEGAGQTLGCTIIAEPDAGLAVDGGKVSVTAGAVPNAVGAAWYLVVSAYGAEPVVAIVPAGEGVTVEPLKTETLRATAVGRVVIESAPATAAVTGDEAAALASRLRAAHKVLAGALATGTALQAMDYAEAYAAERIQFGQPIGKFESIARLIEENRGRLLAARNLVFAAAQALDHGQPEAESLAQHASWIGGEFATQAAIDAVQVYGGYGYVNDYPVEKIMRDARAFTTLAGDGLQEKVMAHSVLA